MRKLLLLLSIFWTALPCLAMERAQGFCTVGGKKVVTQGLQSTNTVMASYPQCQVTVYAHGTTTLATLFSDNGSTSLTNPFTANTDASWGFYAADGSYDAVLSGAGLAVPFTVTVNLGGGGGGGGGCAGAPNHYVLYGSTQYEGVPCLGSSYFTTDGSGDVVILGDNSLVPPNGNVIPALTLFSDDGGPFFTPDPLTVQGPVALRIVTTEKHDAPLVPTYSINAETILTGARGALKGIRSRVGSSGILDTAYSFEADIGANNVNEGVGGVNGYEAAYGAEISSGVTNPNYCDFIAKVTGSFGGNMRTILGCGPTKKTAFYGGVAILTDVVSGQPANILDPGPGNLYVAGTITTGAGTQAVTCPSGGTGTQYCGADGAWHSLPVPAGTSSVIDYSAGVAATTTPGAGVTSATCTANSAQCLTAKGSLQIVGGAATTGTIATIAFNDSPKASIWCWATQNGGATYFGIGHSTPSTSSFSITAAVSVAGQTINIDYGCSE